LFFLLVSCGARWTNGILGFGVHVLSNSHTPKIIAKHVYKFLQDFRFSLNKKDEKNIKKKDEKHDDDDDDDDKNDEEYDYDNFRQQCESLVAIKLEKCTNLSQECSEHWEIISQCRTNMNYSHELNKTPASLSSSSSSSSPSSTKSNNSDHIYNFAFLQSRTEASVIPKVSLKVVKAAMDEWFCLNSSIKETKTSSSSPITTIEYDGGSHIGVFCLGRAATHNLSENDSRNEMPEPRHAIVEFQDIQKIHQQYHQNNNNENRYSASPHTPPLSSLSLWRGPVENLKEAFASFDEFPCFVSGQ